MIIAHFAPEMVFNGSESDILCSDWYPPIFCKLPPCCFMPKRYLPSQPVLNYVQPVLIYLLKTTDTHLH